jgi:chemosensory pili system protein ChpA (sensor histidine kinase/response regulator)
MNEKRAMIVEDDSDLAIIFAEALQAAGYNAEIIQDGQMALDRLSDIVPEVVVLDLHLPRVAGTDILKAIRADERMADTRVIIATADPRMAEALESQADLVLIKPISFSQLRDLASRL